MRNLIKKILNEVNVPHHYQPTGHSCGPTCLKMVHDFFVGDRFKISDICRACGTDWVVGTPPDRMAKGLKYMGIQYVEHMMDEDPFQSIKDAIDKGHPCIVRTVTQGVPHWIIVVDYDADTFMVNDPWLGRILYDREEFDEIWFSGRDKIREYFFYEVTGGDTGVYPDEEMAPWEEDEEIEGYNDEEDEDYMEDEKYYGGFKKQGHWFDSQDREVPSDIDTDEFWEEEEFSDWDKFKESEYGKDVKNKWDIHPNYKSGGESGFKRYISSFGPLTIRKRRKAEYDKTQKLFDNLYDEDYMEDEPEMWSQQWIENILDMAREAVDDETLSMGDLADFDEDTGHQNWGSGDELLHAFVDWYNQEMGSETEEEYEEDDNRYGTQLSLDFPIEYSDEVEISNFTSEKEITDALKIGLNVFEGQMGPKELLNYLAKAADWQISVKATYQGKIVGFYLLSENQIYDYLLHYMMRDYNCYSMEQCNRKHPGSIKVDPMKFKNLDGVEGVALAVDPKYKGLGVGKKLIEYTQNLPYDYVWGQQYEHLGNIEHWIKRREVAAYFPGLYLTYQML